MRLSLRLFVLSLTIFATALLLMPQVSSSDPVETVTNTNDMGPGSLRQAIADVDPGGTIDFDIPGPPPHTIALASMLTINKPLTIEGPGADLLEVTIPDLSAAPPPLLTINDMNSATKIIVNISGISFSRVGPFFFLPPGGIGNSEDLTISDCVLSGFNAAIFNAGGGTGIQTGAILEINNCKVTTSIFGIFNNGGGTDTSEGGTAVVNKSTFSMNSIGIDNNGGDNFNSKGGQVTVNDSNISQNDIGISGGSGGFGMAGGSVSTVNNTTISGNTNAGVQLTGGSTQFGGNTGGAQMTINNSTIANNQAEGIELLENLNDPGLPAVLDIKNSIVGDNGTDCVNDGTFNAFGDNLDTDNTCPTFSTVASGALNLGPLQNNGGSTDTHALISPSSAIDAALDCTFIGGGPVTVDQRFFPRPFGANCDIGAFEAQPTGTLMVEKLTDPPGGPGAEFFGGIFPMGCGLGNFFFLDDMQSESCVLPTGLYTVEEFVPPGLQVDIVCSENPLLFPPNGVTVDIGDGDDVTCTFTNSDIPIAIDGFNGLNNMLLIKNRMNSVDISGVTAGKRAALAWGFQKGKSPIENGVCAGTTVNIRPHNILAKLKSDSQGNIKNKQFFVPSTSANKAFIQPVDLGNCMAGERKKVKLLAD